MPDDLDAKRTALLKAKEDKEVCTAWPLLLMCHQNNTYK